MATLSEDLFGVTQGTCDVGIEIGDDRRPHKVVCALHGDVGKGYLMPYCEALAEMHTFVHRNG